MVIEEILKGKIGFDGCGLAPTHFVQNPAIPQEIVPVSNLRRFVVSHTHRDELPSIESPLLIVPSPLVERIESIYRRYRIKPEIQEHTDIIKTTQYNLVGDKHEKTETYCCFFEDVVYIPERTEARSLVKEFSYYKMGIVHKVSRIDTTEIPITAKELPAGWFLADNKAIGTESPNVIPKCVPTLTDRVILRDNMSLIPLVDNTPRCIYSR